MDWFLLNKGEIHIRIRKTLFVYDLNQCVFSTIGTLSGMIGADTGKNGKASATQDLIDGIRFAWMNE